MERNDLRKLQELYLLESNAFLEGLRQGASWQLLNKKKKRIKEISDLLDQYKSHSKDPSSYLQRGHN